MMVKINIDMPKSCYECKFCMKDYQFAPAPVYYVLFLYCNIMKEFIKYGAYGDNAIVYKYAKCPLEECEEE